MQKQLNNERAIQNSMGKSSSRESDTTFTSIVTNVRRQGSQRKHSLISQDAPEPNLSKKTPETYYTLPHPGYTKKNTKEVQPVKSSKEQQHNKKRRKSHGLTIQIESPTTGEDSSAGIIESSGMAKSPNIFLSGVSISRGHTPVSSPGGRHSRSPSLSIPPPSPNARKNRHRSASLAVPYHKTPPHSPGSQSLVPSLAHYEGKQNLSQFVFPQTSDQTISRFGSLRLSDSTSALSSVLHVQDANLSSDDFHEALFMNKLQRTPKKRKRSKKSRANSKEVV
eukprot:TRINITY_DN67962_c0_g1_i1.p1 TRINITY_DN67962_c0_g1~~TRINITY_DN67962_c0_g1_i1.p1  ORF type:complete len:280 (-),score=57.89 TRINITY_DN67962_c0_g1_i1:207-1046(-)